MHYEYATISQKGDRPINEDCVGAKKTPAGIFLIVADGLGGHGQGEVASLTAVNTILSVIDLSPAKGKELLETAIGEAHRQILEEQRRQGARTEMKTTITLLHVGEKGAEWAHIGDSRIYQFKKGKVINQTKDHSVPQMLVNQGLLDARKIRGHEDRNRLIRVLGNDEELPKIEITEGISIDANTAFLLCSDGFWELIQEKEMCRLLRKSKTPADWLSLMEREILEAGEGTNMDNYSAAAIFMK